jgi:nucleoside-diphosphate-sugar epimerase
MRAIVTGGSGFIGRHVTRRLLEGGDDVTVIDVAPEQMDGARLVRASVLDADAMAREIRDADAVIHLAGYVRDGMRRDLYGGTQLQLQGTLNVLEACRANGVGRIAYASSFYVYDGLPPDSTVDERMPLDPRCMEMFGSAKLMGEALCREYADHGGPEYVVYRFGPAYGPGGSSAVGHFIERGLEGEAIDIWGTGKRRNQYTYVGDIADAVVNGLDSPGETFNVISPEAVTIRELTEILEQEFGFVSYFDESKPEGPSFPLISAEKACAELAWSPVPLLDGLRSTMSSMSEDNPPQAGTG